MPPVPQSNLCASCGNDLKKNWKACPYCGAAVSGAKAEGQQAAPPPQPVSPSATVQAAPPPAKKHILRNVLIAAGVVVVVAVVGIVWYVNVSPAAWYKRGMEYVRNEDYDEALADYSAALRINSEFAEAYAERGYVYSLMDDPARAFED
jgi:tetratricopeptide (TPR) repeat protein